jgi:hypothetical protein
MTYSWRIDCQGLKSILERIGEDLYVGDQTSASPFQVVSRAPPCRLVRPYHRLEDLVALALGGGLRRLLPLGRAGLLSLLVRHGSSLPMASVAVWGSGAIQEVVTI